MKKKMYQNAAAAHFREHSSIYLFIIVLFLMGVIFGAIVVNSLSFTQKEDLFYYLSQFFGQVSDGHVAAADELFKQSFFHNTNGVGRIFAFLRICPSPESDHHTYIYSRCNSGCFFLFKNDKKTIYEKSRSAHDASFWKIYDCFCCSHSVFNCCSRSGGVYLACLNEVCCQLNPILNI